MSGIHACIRGVLSVRAIWGIGFGLMAAVIVAPAAAQQDQATHPPEQRFPANHPRIEVLGTIDRGWVADTGVLRFDRRIEVRGKRYRWDNPGARIQFYTAARAVAVYLRYNEKHLAGSARNGVGAFRIDGRADPAWRFSSRERTGERREPEDVVVRFPLSSDGQVHRYEVILPYGDSVDLVGVGLSPEGTLAEPPANRPVPVRYIAFGDSVTQGFTASEVVATYPVLVADHFEWEVVNAGYAGRRTYATDGALITSLRGDVITLLIGVNDWQGGTPPESYEEALRGLVQSIRDQQPQVPVYVITPLWVSETWKPKAAQFPLERYREAARAVVAQRVAAGDAYTRIVEGPSLIDPTESNFDPVLVHPNDAGFAQLAQRLTAILSREPVQAAKAR